MLTPMTVTVAQQAWLRGRQPGLRQPELHLPGVREPWRARLSRVKQRTSAACPSGVPSESQLIRDMI